MNRPRKQRLLGLIPLTALLLTACSGGAEDVGQPTPPPGAGPGAAVSPNPPSTGTPPGPATPPSPTASPAAVACPARYAAPDPQRPDVDLTLDFSADHASVTGTEVVVFTPDRDVDRLVFRLWPNSPRTAEAGADLRVQRASVDGREARYTISRAGGLSGHTGTLLNIPLERPRARGRRIAIGLDFTLRLPTGANDRMGHRGNTAWLASGVPLLAWQRGRGWATEPATAVFAEATTSEDFRLRRLEVTTAASDVVLATGVTDRVTPARKPGRRTHRLHAEAVRDVMVAVGPFRVHRRPGPTPVTVGVAPGLDDDPEEIARLTEDSIRAHAARFGPFPYPDLDIAVVPDLGGGVEYPAAMLLGTGQAEDATLSHEVAHEWFYGLVGDNQGRDPWLDESFATYAEGLHRGTAGSYRRAPVSPAGRHRVGASMTYWESRRDIYHRSVYDQGAAMLLEAREAAGADRFDAALRCYVAANAHRIATPQDLERALARLPKALAVLRRYGALPAR